MRPEVVTQGVLLPPGLCPPSWGKGEEEAGVPKAWPLPAVQTECDLPQTCCPTHPAKRPWEVSKHCRGVGHKQMRLSAGGGVWGASDPRRPHPLGPAFHYLTSRVSRPLGGVRIF